MPETRPPDYDEIDLLEIFQTLWNGKRIILATTLISLLAMIGYLSFQKIDFKATTEVKPLFSFDLEIYKASNTQGFFEVTQDRLMSLFIEQLGERDVFEEAIVKYELLDPKNFEDEQTFNEAVTRLAYSIKLLPPVETKKQKRNKWVIEAEYYDKNKWIQFLYYVNSMANQILRNNLQKSFENALKIAKQRQDFQIEDINTKIENAKTDYEIETSNKLFYLKEQAAIARELGVAKNSLEAPTFGIQNNIIANLQTDYLRGYEAIEKEIVLIESRQNKRAFVVGLLELEQEKRKIVQEGIMLVRAESLFKNTPIMDEDDFFAASVMVVETVFEDSKKKIIMLALAAILGGIIASLYVLIPIAMHRRKDNSVKA